MVQDNKTDQEYPLNKPAITNQEHHNDAGQHTKTTPHTGRAIPEIEYDKRNCLTLTRTHLVVSHQPG